MLIFLAMVFMFIYSFLLILGTTSAFCSDHSEEDDSLGVIPRKSTSSVHIRASEEEGGGTPPGIRHSSSLSDFAQPVHPRLSDLRRSQDFDPLTTRGKAPSKLVLENLNRDRPTS